MADKSSASRRGLWIAGGLGLAAVAAAGICLAAVVIGVIISQRARPAANQPAVEYILDVSPRMNELTEGGTRLSVAQAALAEIVRPSDPSIASGFRIFGSGASADPCQDTDLIVPLSPSNQTLITRGIFRAQLGDATESSLAQAMIAAIRDLVVAAGPHTLVVITGGIDTCDPQANQLIAQEAERAGIELKTFIVGYDMSGEGADAIKAMVENLPGSTYVAASDTASLDALLSALKNYIDSPTEGSLADLLAAASPVVVEPPNLADYQPQTACDHPYFPLRPGATWTYASSSVYTYTQTVAAVEGDLEQARATVVVATPWLRITQQWECRPEGIALVSADYERLEPTATPYASLYGDLVSGLKLIPAADLTPGAVWEESHALTWDGQNRVEWSSSFAVVSDGGLATPAGQFYTLRIEETDITRSASGDLAGAEAITWYAYGVGPVSITTRSQTNTVASYVLQRYQIP